MKLSDLDTPIIEVYLSPIYGCKKPTVWIAYVGGMIKLGTFVNKETAEMFIEYFESLGIAIEVLDFGSEEDDRV